MYIEETLDLSFDCVLPTAIFYNQNIEPAAIRFYAIVRNLTRMSGYCFATNGYLSKLLGFDESTIKRWLSSLTKEGFLEIETDKQGIHWQRKIYLADKFKKVLRRLKNELPPAQNCAPPSSKMSYIIEDKTKEDKKKKEEEYSSNRSETDLVSPKVPKISFCFQKFRFEDISIEDVHDWKELYPTVDIDRELKAMTEWIKCNENRARSKKKWRAFITNWLQKNHEKNVNKQAFQSQGKSYETDRRRKDEFGNPIRSQYADILP